MKRFRFRLEALLRIRRENEERVKLRLAGKNREIIAAVDDMNGFYRELKDLQASEKAARGPGASALLLRYGAAYRYRLKDDILKTGRHLEELNAEAAGIKREMLEATRKRRALEAVRDRQFAEWKKAYRRREQSVIDDVAQRKYIDSLL